MKVRLSTAALLLPLFLAVACAPADAPTAEMAAPTTDAAAVDTGAPTDAPAAMAGALGTLDIQPGDPIKLGYMLVVAGDNQTLGLDARRGVELAIADTPAVLGHTVELTGEDSGCSAEGGQAAATKLAADKSLVAVIGSSCSSEAVPGAPIISDSGLTMLSPSATAPILTDPAKRVPGFFRTAHNDKVQGQVGAEFVYNGLGLKKVATINDGSPYSAGLVDAFESSYKGLGGEVVAHEAVSDKDTDMHAVLTTIGQTSPEFLYYPVFSAGGGYITTQKLEIAALADVPGMGADGMFSPDFLKAAGDAAEGMYLSSPDFSVFGSDYKDKFLPAHEKAYGEKPISAFHAHAYDAANIIFAAIEKVAVQDADGTLHIDRQAFRDAIGATKDFKGLTGNLTCDPNGDCADPVLAVYKINLAEVTAGKGLTEMEKVWPK
ncbi:MAG: branched-chain amino acid ABC transporter substrate-binding protein [Ardenticatenales bacterium]